MYKTYGLFLILIASFGVIYLHPLPVHADPPPPATNIDSIEDCVFRGYGTESVTHSFLLNGYITQAIKYASPVVKITLPAKDGELTTLHTFLHMQGSDLFGSLAPDYYLDISEFNGDEGAGSSLAARIFFNSSSIPTGASSSDVYTDPNSSAAKKYWIIASRNSSGLLGQYFKWIAENADEKKVGGKCDFTADTAGYAALSGAKTLRINRQDAGGGKIFYYVAHGNYSKFNGSQNVDGYIYRNGNEFIAVDKSGTVGQTFTTGSSKDWEPANAKVLGFSAPFPIVSSSQTFNHIKLPSDAGSNILVTFNPPLTDPPDVSGKDKNITLEILLDSEHGPFTNKELVDITDVGHTGQYDESSPNQGFKNDIYVLEQKDLVEAYGGVGFVPQPHKNELVRTIVVCAHKILDKTGITSGFVTLKLADNTTNNFSAALGDIKMIKVQGDGVSDWTSVQSPLKIPSKIGTQTCGTGDETSVPGQIPDQLTPDISLADIIFNALKAVGTIIQNFIIYIVSLAINLASSAVPI